MRLCALLLALHFAFQCRCERCTPSVVLISADGFRWDYLERNSTPNIHKMRSLGVSATQVENSFITKTFPNHWSIVTGAYEETHGIVANAMLDLATHERFTMATCGTWWDAVEPLWTTLERLNKSTATYFWPGSNCAINGVLPRRYMVYNASVPFDQRVDTVLGWLSEDCATRPALVTLYFHEPDSTGHTYGPDSPELLGALRGIDDAIGRLLEGLEVAALMDQVNVILTSDHGMASTSPERVVYLEDYISDAQYQLINEGPIAAILPLEGQEEFLYRALVGRHPNMTVYLKKDLPTRWHYQHPTRVMPIVAVSDEGWLIQGHRGPPIIGGNHGYDNALPSMHPLFVASGPSFKVDLTIPSIRNVDIYPLMCYLLHIPCPARNGTLSSVSSLLHREGDGLVSVIIAGSLLAVSAVCLAVFLLWRRYGHGAPAAPGGQLLVDVDTENPTVPAKR